MYIDSVQLIEKINDKIKEIQSDNSEEISYIEKKQKVNKLLNQIDMILLVGKYGNYLFSKI